MSTVPPNEAKQDCIEPSVEMKSHGTHDAWAEQARSSTIHEQAVKAAANDEATISPVDSRPEQPKSEVIEIPLHDLFVEYANGRWIRGSYLIVTDRGTKATARVSVDTLQQYAEKRSIRSNPKVQAALDEMMRTMQIKRQARCPTLTVEGFFRKAEQELLRTLSEAVEKDHRPTFREASQANAERPRSSDAGIKGAKPVEDEQQ